MNLIFSSTELESLISYVEKNSDNSELLGQYALQCLKNGECIISITNTDLSDIPLYVTKKDLKLTFCNKHVIDFFVTAYYLSKVETNNYNEIFNQLNELSFDNKFKIKPENVNEYFILLLNKIKRKKIIDILTEPKTDFWTNYHSFINVFPHLTLSIEEFCEILKFISLKTTGDGAENEIYTLLKDIPKLNLNFAEILYENLFLPTNEEILKYIGVVVEGLNKYKSPKIFQDKILYLLQTGKVENIIAGLQMISRLEYKDHTELAQAIYGEIVIFINDDRENIRYAVTCSLITLSKICPDAQSKLTELSKKEDVSYRYPISDFVWRSTTNENITENIKQLAFNLSTFKCTNVQLMNYVNWHITDSFKKGDKEYGVKLLESWLGNGQDINSMEHVISKFIRSDFSWFCSIITPWFNKSDKNLMNALMSITSRTGKDIFKLNQEILNSYSDLEIGKIIGSIMGFIYLKEPLASLTLSILDSKHLEQQANNIETLFVDYICYTYPSSLANFIKPEISISKGTKKKLLQRIVKRVDKYYDDLKNLPILKELNGSETRKRSFNNAFDNQQSKRMNTARKENIFEQLAKNIVLRSGPIWFSKNSTGYSAESHLQPVNFSFEMPRAENIDPAGFEIFRSRMRYESLKE